MYPKKQFHDIKSDLSEIGNWIFFFFFFFGLINRSANRTLALWEAHIIWKTFYHINLQTVCMVTDVIHAQTQTNTKQVKIAHRKRQPALPFVFFSAPMRWFLAARQQYVYLLTWLYHHNEDTNTTCTPRLRFQTCGCFSVCVSSGHKTPEWSRSVNTCLSNVLNKNSKIATAISFSFGKNYSATAESSGCILSAQHSSFCLKRPHRHIHEATDADWNVHY